MNLFDQNIELIGKYRKELYKGLMEINDDERDKLVETVQVFEARDGNLILNIEKQSKQYRLNSSYRPLEEAVRWTEQYDFKNMYKVISLFGYGNGMCAQQIIDRMTKEDLLLIYEPSIDIFFKVLENFDLKDIIENRQVVLSIVGVNEKQFADAVRDNVEWLNLYSQIICSSPQYEKLFAENYRDFLRIIRDNNNRAVLNRNTEATLGQASSCNVIRNLEFLGESNMATDLHNLLPLDIPVIIVAAGPSLDKNVQQLKYAKGKAIIIATDTAINRMLSYDIIPDFTITLDPSKPIRFYNDERGKDIPLFYQLPSNSEIVTNHTGRKFIYNRNAYVTALLNDFNKRACFNGTGGSVATAAFSVCVSIGFKRIILVGQDLAFSGNITHAGDVKASDKQMNQQMIMVEDIYGNMIPSPWNLYTFLLWFNDTISVSKDIDVIDATEGGAKITGTTIMSLKDAIEEYCNQDINILEMIDKLNPTFNSNEMLKINEYLGESLDDLDLIGSKAKQVVVNAEKLIKLEQKYSEKESVKSNLVKRISKAGKWIEKRMVYHLLAPYIAMEVSNALSLISRIDEDENQRNENIKIYQKVVDTYSAIVNGTDEIRPLLEDTAGYYKTRGEAE